MPMKKRYKCEVTTEFLISFKDKHDFSPGFPIIYFIVFKEISLKVGLCHEFQHVTRIFGDLLTYFM